MTDDELAHLYEDCFEQDVDKWSAAAIGNLRKSRNNLVIEAAQSACFMQFAADQSEILSLFVHAQQRREGAARALVEQAFSLSRGRGARQVYLEVAEDNTAAINLYRSLGFEQIGRRKKYYRRKNASPVDALTMMCDI